MGLSIACIRPNLSRSSLTHLQLSWNREEGYLMSEQQFQRLESKIIFRDETLGLRKDLVRTPSGNLLWRKVVEYQKASTVVALTEDLRVLLIRHFRYPVNTYVW